MFTSEISPVFLFFTSRIESLLDLLPIMTWYGSPIKSILENLTPGLSSLESDVYKRHATCQKDCGSRTYKVTQPMYKNGKTCLNMSLIRIKETARNALCAAEVI